MNLDHYAEAERRRVAEAVLDAALDAIIVINGAGSIVEWNPAAEDLFHWRRDEALGRPLADLIVPEELRNAHRDGLRNYMSTGEGPALDTRLTLPGLRKDGSRLTVELTISPTDTTDGPLFTGWIRDITEIVAARTAVEQSERRLASLVANVSDVITVMAADGSWISTSGAGTRLLGYQQGFDPDGGVFSLIHPEDVELAERAFAEVVAGTRTSAAPVDLRVRAIDGSWHVLENVAENLVDDPTVNGVIVTSRDVTLQRARADEQRKRASQLSLIAHSLSDGILFADEHERVVFVNPAFREIFGLVSAPEELADLSLRDVSSLMPPSAGTEGVLTMTPPQLRRDGLPVVAEVISLRDGRTLERDYTRVELEDGVCAHLWFYRDITTRTALRKAQERRLNAERTLREQAEEQTRILQEVSDLKSELVATVSHELRTPLTSIVSFSELLHADLQQPATFPAVASSGESDVREYVEVIARNAQRLVRLVDDLLLLAELESGTVPLDAADARIAEIIDRVVMTARHSSADSGVSIRSKVEAGPVSFVDAHRIEQVVENLVSNAIKFTPAGGVIEVRAHHDGTAWIVSVSDDGAGIPLDEQDQLFESFYRGSSSAKETQGTGLGLAISHAIVDIHGGTFSVESQPGIGSTFSFSLPDEGRNA